MNAVCQFLRDQAHQDKAQTVAYKIKYQIDKASSDSRKRCLIYGNCQVHSLAAALSSNPLFASTYKLSPIKTVHTLNREETSILLKYVKKTDLLIYQPVKRGYRAIPELSTNFLKAQMKPNAKAVAVPSMYFPVYSPEVFYLRGSAGEICPGPFGDYHNLFIYFAYVTGKTINKTLSIMTDGDLLNSEFSENNLNQAIKEMKRREQEHQLVVISDFIRQKYKEHRLFYTMNHPSKLIIHRVAFGIYQATNLLRSFSSSQVAKASDQAIDSLNKKYFSIHPAIFKQLKLSFDYDSYTRLNREPIKSISVIERFFRFYDQGDWAIGNLDSTRKRMSYATQNLYDCLFS